MCLDRFRSSQSTTGAGQKGYEGLGIVDLSDMCKQWYTFAEARLVQMHGLEPQDAVDYVGRAEGPRLCKVPLWASWDKNQRGRFSSTTTAWIAFQTLLFRCRESAAGKVGHRGRKFLHRWRDKLIGMIPSLDASDGPLSPAILEHLAAVAAEGHLDFGDRISGELDDEVNGRRKQDAKASLKEWRTWAVQSTKGGGKAAHAVSRRALSSCSSLLDESGRPVCGQDALDHFLTVWGDLWQVDGRGALHPSSWEVGWRRAHPPFPL